MKDEEVVSRYKAITANLPKDENGFIGNNPAQKFDNMWVYLTMAVTGETEECVRYERSQYALELKQKELQKSIAENCP